MRQVPLIFPFSLALFFAIFGTVVLPDIRLFAFSPFLAILYNKASLVRSLWIATLCGLIVDLFCSEFRLGVYALNFCLTTLALYKQKKHFFEDKPLALCLFTALISVASTVAMLLLIFVFDYGLPFSKRLILTDLILMPIVDALYAFVWFFCPMMLYLHIQKMGWRAFCSKVLSTFRSQ